jgi:hypothetical protein
MLRGRLLCFLTFARNFIYLNTLYGFTDVPNKCAEKETTINRFAVKARLNSVVGC